jgi:GT2 family glycosyltransferase
MNSASKIAIIIITYNRPDDMLELAKNISKLDHQELLDEVLIVNNKSTDNYQVVEDFINSQAEIPFRYIMAPENLGVAKGRNFAVTKTSSPILFFIDDDALFKNKDALFQVSQIFDEPSNQPAGIAAFKVYYHSTMQLQVNAFPHKNFEERKDWHHFDTYYFSGCAHAIRREVFEKAGYYPENFFYGMEEYDLSYRVINDGMKIIYDDRVVVLHKESPEGRLTNKEKLRGMWVNKSKVAWKFLPKKYFYSTSFLWSGQYLRKTGWDLGGWFKGWKEISKIPSQEKRTPINQGAIQYLKQVKARLTY